MYQRNVRRRIRPAYREYRDTLVVEAAPIPVATITVGESDTAVVQGVRLRFLLGLQKIGVGSLAVFFENFGPQTEEQWLAARDPRLVSVRFANPVFGREEWGLITFVRFVILLAYMGLLQVGDFDAESMAYSATIEEDSALEDFLQMQIGTGSDGMTHSTLVEVDNYPFLYVQYDLSTSELADAVAASPGDIRLALCGDRNWRCKTREVIQRSVFGCNTSSRDSVFWYVNSEGVVKLASRELETPFEESVTAMLLESDIVLTMRYFLQSINRVLLEVSNTRVSPLQLSAVREELFSTLDKYCNLEVSHKDTTRWRIERYKEFFRVDALYFRVLERFELLGDKMATVHTAVVREQQATMTLVFGFFGSVNALLFLAYQIPRPTGKHVPWWALWWTPAVGSVVLASVATLALWTLLRALRERV
jgi:hypothetical protein